MRRLLLSLLLLSSVASAQIGLPLPQLLRRVSSLAPLETAQGYQARGVRFEPELRGGALYKLTGEARLGAAGKTSLAQLIGAASGYGEGIAQPLGQFFDEQIAEIAGRGPVPLAVEEFVLTLDVTGEAAPYRATFALALLETPEDAFPKAQHTLGPKNAKIVIREFSDFQCPYCAQYAQNTLPLIKAQLLKRGDVRFEFHHLPLSSIHANAQIAGEAAECVTGANAPEAFWTFHDALFARQQAWQALGNPEPYFARLARELGLSGEGVAACLEQGRYTKRVQDATQTATEALGLNSTPTVFVGGFRVSGGAVGTITAYETAIARLEAFSQP